MALIISSALLVGLVSLVVLLWAMASGQYDDPEGDAARILLDDDCEGSGRAITAAIPPVAGHLPKGS